MTPELSLAERMYPSQQLGTAETGKVPEKVEPNFPLTSARPPAREEPALSEKPQPSEEPRLADALYPGEVAAKPAQLTIDELAGADRSLADELYGDGSSRPESPEGYRTTLDESFGPLEREARWVKDDAGVLALAEGRQQAAVLMHELRVPASEAGDLVRTFGDWNNRAPMEDEAKWDANDAALDKLEAKWGKEADARIKLAQQTAREACRRLPWLGPLLASGAGNDPAIIERFAEIGLRNARRARK